MIGRNNIGLTHFSGHPIAGLIAGGEPSIFVILDLIQILHLLSILLSNLRRVYD